MNIKIKLGMGAALFAAIKTAAAQMGTISIEAKAASTSVIVYLSIGILITLFVLFILLKMLFSSKRKPRQIKMRQNLKPEEKEIVKPRYNREQIRKERTERIKERKREALITHLKDDEKQIIEILKLKGGRCEQGTLQTITNFSKAKLSELLSELAERKMIIKEKKGRKNLIVLAEA